MDGAARGRGEDTIAAEAHLGDDLDLDGGLLEAEGVDCGPVEAGEDTIARRSADTASGQWERTVSETGHGASLTLYATWFCPYAQRAWIALEEAGAAYHWAEVKPYLANADGTDSKNPKPLSQKAAENPDFVAASPKGLVPALVHRSAVEVKSDGVKALGTGCPFQQVTRVHESMDCVDYVDRVLCAGRLRSGDALLRHANHVVDTQITPHFYRLLMERGAAERAAAALALCEGLLQWADARPSASRADGGWSEGPYFLGDTFSAADIALAPWFPQRLDWIAGTYRHFALPDGEEFRPLRRFAAAMRARPSVVSTLVSRERLVANYSGYADNSATSAVALTFRRAEACTGAAAVQARQADSLPSVEAVEALLAQRRAKTAARPHDGGETQPTAKKPRL